METTSGDLTYPAPTTPLPLLLDVLVLQTNLVFTITVTLQGNKMEAPAQQLTSRVGSAFLSAHVPDFQSKDDNSNELIESLGVFRSSRVDFPVTSTTSCRIFPSPAQPQHPAGGNGASRPFTYQSHPSWLSLPVPNEKQPSVTCSLGFSKLGDCNASQEIREIHFPSI